jgi:hypothetical protein
MLHRRAWVLIAMMAAQGTMHAQWAVYRDPAIPRGRDGKPNLSAPAPRVGGKPDLSGIWIPESSPVEEIKQFLLPEGINGLGETIPSKYFFNFFADVPFGQEPMQPAARASYDKRPQGPGKPATLCPLPTVPMEDVIPVPFKIVQTPRVMMMLYEDVTVFRQIFTDGRKLPDDPQPSWLGYSVGMWMRDSFAVETVGLNDRAGLDIVGHSRSESTRLTESFRRRDFGHMELQITVDDAKTYTKPVSIRVNLRLLADTELIESFCTEDEKDLVHFLAR